MLLGEAETVDLGEILAGLERRHVEGRGAGKRRVGQVGGPVKGQRRLAGPDRDLRLLGKEPPRQGRVGVGVEANGDGPARGRGGRGLGGDLRRAAEAGDLAEQLVQRHRGEGQPDHAPGDGKQHHGGEAVFLAVVGAHRGHGPVPVAYQFLFGPIRPPACRSCPAVLRRCGRGPGFRPSIPASSPPRPTDWPALSRRRSASARR